jgi:hypothetical protein
MSARVTSSLFVAALVRQAGIDGIAAVVARHGAEEAGAIFVCVDRLDGTSDLYSPAPQSAFAADDDGGRLFTCVKQRATDAEIAAAIAREARFDSDLWVVALEDREGRPFVPLAKD